MAPMTKQDFDQFMSDYSNGIPLEQIVREFSLSHPPDVEVYASQFKERYQMGVLKARVRVELERVSVVGLETFNAVGEFISVIGVCMKHGWIEDWEWEAISYQLNNWFEGRGIVGSGGIADRKRVEEAESRLMAIAEGLSKRVFQEVTFVN